MSVTPLVLAAGQGRRFGDGSKLLADLGGRSVLGRVFDRLAEAELTAGLVALPDDSRGDALSAEIPRGFEALRLDQSQVGMGLSMAALAARVPEGNGALVVLGDQPLLTARALRDLLDCAESGEIARLCHSGAAGHPVLFPATLVPELTRLSGDEGARGVLKQHGYRAVEVDVPEVLCDVDTPEALEALRAHV